MATEAVFLFGQYTDWGKVTYFHLFTLLLVFTFVLLLYALISKRVTTKRNNLCNDIMKGRLRFDEKNQSRKDRLTTYFNKQKELISNLKPELNLSGKLINGDPGYDKQNIKNIHYNTSIAKSYFVLEEGVRSIRPNLRHRNYRTIREFVDAIKYEFPELKNQCDRYTDFYELARFGNYKCTQIEYQQFFALLKEMVTKLQSNNQQQ